MKTNETNKIYDSMRPAVLASKIRGAESVYTEYSNPYSVAAQSVLLSRFCNI